MLSSPLKTMEYNKRTQNGWAFYDWANSVYSLVISTAIFPVYYSSVTASETNSVHFLGTDWENTVIYSYVLSFSFVIVALISPILGGIADYTGSKKKFMQFFAAMGALSCGVLFFFDGTNVALGLWATIFASVGFWGSLVFYNAFLPEIAPVEQQDRLSAKGFSLGYMGSAILLIGNLVLINKGADWGITDSTLPARISFLTVAIWWFGFAQITFRRLPDNVYGRRPDKHIIKMGFREIRAVYQSLPAFPQLRQFLIAFLLLSVGVQTIILMASVFGQKELGLPAENLILTILIIQLVAIVGARLFARLSERYGNFRALIGAVFVWMFISVAAYLLPVTSPRVDLMYYSLGGLVGMVMGGIQSLSRSTYSKMLPDTKDHASYFSFFDLTEKIAIIGGTFVFGFMESITGSMKLSSLAMGIFFLSSALVLISMEKKSQLAGTLGSHDGRNRP